MWMLLIGGGTITVAWLYLFYAKSSRRQMALVAVVGGYSGFVVFLVYALQHPFAGDVAITPDVYRDLLDSW
ncbi:MAG: hypothetical protein ACRDLS_10180 [Solirubrobacteraceae bacterium]